MISDLLFALLGLVILLLAGDSLVRGAVNLSLRLGVPALIVGLTIVAFGTSAPELLVSVKAVLDGVPGIALGNVVGSNIANILLVLGIPAILSGLRTDECDTRRSYVTMIAASALFYALIWFGPLSWWHGLILLGMLTLILGDNFIEVRNHRQRSRDRADAARAEADDADPDAELEDLEGADPSMPVWKIAIFLVLGLIGLPLGADLLVDSSVNIARVMGISETVIGLTLIAVGTSLPELATTVMAAIRRQADVALGNVIGSNFFNLLAIMGITGLVGDVHIPAEMLYVDVPVMLGASLLLAPFVFRGWFMGKAVGTLFILFYATYVVSLIS